MDVSTNHCGLVITDSNANYHDGTWDCSIFASGTTQYRYNCKIYGKESKCRFCALSILVS